MEVKTPFKITDLPEGWSVSWPGFEYNVVNNPRKADTLLKILFDEVGVDHAVLWIKEEDNPDREGYTLTINWMAWHQNPDQAGEFLARKNAVVACKFDTQTQAEKFKTIMDRRLAWRRLGGTWK